MEREINKKLRNMTKSQLEKVCGKMRWNQEGDGYTIIKTIDEV
jgi:hypothetical protein